jgi:hypothetical protein
MSDNPAGAAMKPFIKAVASRITRRDLQDYSLSSFAK